MSREEVRCRLCSYGTRQPVQREGEVIACSICKPWEWFTEGAGKDDPETSYLRVYDHEMAAEQVLENHHSDWDHTAEERIWVRKRGEDKWRCFDVMVEMEPTFRGREIEETADG